MRALVVDSSAIMRKVLMGALGRANVTDVDQAADGVEAVAATEEHDYDLVLIDWILPNMLGIDAVRAIRANGKTMPIIMVTNQAEKSRVIEAQRAGVQNYVIKPVEPATMVKKIQEVLAKANEQTSDPAAPGI